MIYKGIYFNLTKDKEVKKEEKKNFNIKIVVWSTPKENKGPSKGECEYQVRNSMLLN